MKRFTFYKQQDRWYVDLPDWDGSQDDLEMVCGADILLDIISQGEDKAVIYWSEQEIEHYKYSLTKLREEEFGGATYLVEGNNITPFEAWLCDVTVFVFNYFPNKLYLL
jgi:hypothetical protein